MKKLLILACAAIALVACNQPPASMENPTIQTILSRVSVREFTGEKISEAQIDTLLRAAMLYGTKSVFACKIQVYQRKVG